jgi:AraC-like DNA-binding protein
MTDATTVRMSRPPRNCRTSVPETCRETSHALQGAFVGSPLLKEFLAAFSATTGIVLRVLEVGSGEIELLEALRQHEFCALLVNTEPERLRCVRRLRKLIARVTADGFAVSASICGFSYLGMALRARESMMGILLAGPMFPRTPRAGDWMRASHHLPTGRGAFDYRSVRNAYFDIPVVSHSRLDGVMRLVSMFAEHISESTARLLISTAEAQPLCVTLAKQFIQDNSEEPLSVADVAHRVTLHPDYLGKVFRNATGMTLTEYIARVRVENAKERLPERSCRVAEVAFAAGFQSLAQFNRDFKKYAGMCPSRYRASLLTGQLYVLSCFMLLLG